MSIYWPIDNQYYDGRIISAENNVQLNIQYNDGDVESIDLNNEDWKLYKSLAENSSMVTNSATELQVDFSTSEVLSSMVEEFVNKPFLKHQSQNFEQFLLIKSYKEDEESFLMTVKVIPRNNVTYKSNLISIHTLYKVKKNDDGSLKLKARIAPHGNEDNLKDVLNKDFSTCPPTVLRIVESISSFHIFTAYKGDVKAAFLQTGKSDGYDYLRPPRENQMKSTHIRLLLTAEHGLFNSNAEWQNQSDAVMFELGLVKSKYITQLFFKKEGGNLILVVEKIFDFLKAVGTGDNSKIFLE